MPRVVDDDELGGGQSGLQCPGVAQRRLEIEPAVDEDAWDVSEDTRLAQKDAVLQPEVVNHVVRDDAGVSQRVRGVGEARRKAFARRP